MPNLPGFRPTQNAKIRRIPRLRHRATTAYPALPSQQRPDPVRAANRKSVETYYRPWVVKTYCRICEAACGLDAEIDGGRVGSLRPDHSHPVSKGFVCAKGTRFAEVATHPSRVIYPMRRTRDAGDRTGLTRISWTAAIDETGARIRAIVERHGPDSLGVYFGNPIAFNSLGSVALMALLDSLRTRNVFSAGSQDYSNKFAGARILYDSPIIQPLPDFARCDLAVVFGSNPLVSQSSFVRLEGGSRVFQAIVDRGGHVVWVDPRRTESATRWGRPPCDTPRHRCVAHPRLAGAVRR